MRLAKWLVVPVVVVLAAGASRAADEKPTFAKDIKPFLAKYCMECHQGGKAKAGVRVTTYEELLKEGRKGIPVVAGKPEKSLLITSMEGKGAKKMPPAKYQSQPTAKEIAVVKAWIMDGAKEKADAAPSLLAPGEDRGPLCVVRERAVAILTRRDRLSAGVCDRQVA
ncbi:MAG: hypothetical protein K2R98_11900 [Gemmataceae bacterium]|nr:hypothetical protein [Gemmataceae bacterium]